MLPSQEYKLILPQGDFEDTLASMPTEALFGAVTVISFWLHKSYFSLT